MKHAIITGLLTAALAATAGAPALAAGHADTTNPPHPKTPSPMCNAVGSLNPGRSGEEIPTLTGGGLDPGCNGAGLDPAQWTELNDDTGTISISVPATWTAVDVTPGQDGDGTPQPWISATTDASLFLPPQGTADTFGVPGVVSPPSRSSRTRRQSSRPPGITTSAPPTRCRPSTTAYTPATSRRSTLAAVRRRASSRSPPTHRTVHTRQLC